MVISGFPTYHAAQRNAYQVGQKSSQQHQTYCILQHQVCCVQQLRDAHQCCSAWQKPLKVPVFRNIFSPKLQLRTGVPAGWDTECGFLQSSTVLNCHMDSQPEAQRQFWPSLAPHLNFQYFLSELGLEKIAAQLICLLQSSTKRASHTYLTVLDIDADITNEGITE